MTISIHVRDLRKSFDGVPALDGVDLDVERGTVLALLGPNGAGKSTLVGILATLVEPDGGVLTVEGIDVRRDPASVRGVIGVTGQSAAVDELLTAEENLRMMGRLVGLSRMESRRRSAQLLGQFDLADSARKPVGRLSGGMRRRLDLALSLLATPPVLFLDEPTTGLDVRSRQALWEVIRSLRANGTTVLLTTQYLEEADQLADRIAVLDAGRIVASGTGAELKARVGGEVLELRAPDGTVIAEERTDGSLHGLRRAVETIDRGPIEATVELRRPSLDDVFLALTGGDAERAATAVRDPLSAGALTGSTRP